MTSLGVIVYYACVDDNPIGRCTIARIKDIAERAGVSIGTVDRVLHKRGRVRKDTEDKVRQVIDQLAYKPNIFAKNLKLGRDLTVGVLMPKPSQDSMYWALPVKGINRAQKELDGQRVRVRYFFFDKYSENSFKTVARVVLNADLDGLLVAPVLPKVFKEFLARVPDETPYVFFDSFIPDARYRSYIGQDSFQSGLLSCRMMRLLAQDEGTIAVLRVLPADYHINDRVRGFVSHCRRCRMLKHRVYDIDGDKGQEVWRRTFRRMQAENEDLRGIFVTNASVHRLASVISEEPDKNRPHLIGYDLVEESIHFLREGVIQFLISQQPERQGYEGILALYRIAVLGEPVKKTIMMQLDLVTAESVDYYQS